MKAYSYHPMTNEYLGVTEADKSPLEPGVYLVPGRATLTAPPATGEHEVAVWNGTAWEIRADYRGITSYDAATCTATVISEIGVAPEITEAPPAGLYAPEYVNSSWRESAAGEALARAAQIAEIDAELVSIERHLTRSLEDYLESIGFDISALPYQKTRLDRKIALRAARKALVDQQ